MSELRHDDRFLVAPGTLEQITWDMDWDMRDIANHIPREAKLVPAGIPVTLYEDPEVGKLMSTWLGARDLEYRFLIEAIPAEYARELGRSKIFNQLYGPEMRLLDTDVSTPEMFQEYPGSVALLGMRIRQLHDGYIASQGDPTVVRMADQLRARRIQLPGIELIRH